MRRAKMVSILLAVGVFGAGFHLGRPALYCRYCETFYNKSVEVLCRLVVSPLHHIVTAFIGSQSLDLTTFLYAPLLFSLRLYILGFLRFTNHLCIIPLISSLLIEIAVLCSGRYVRSSFSNR